MKQTSHKRPYNKTKNEPENIHLRTTANIRCGYEEGKTIAVSKLPDCQHKTMLIDQCGADDTARICVIAIRRGMTDKWIAYAGYPDPKDTKLKDEDFNTGKSIYLWSCENIHNVEQVKMLGEILDKKTAAKLFPDWDIKQYSLKLAD